jgi:hypothetical protein
MSYGENEVLFWHLTFGVLTAILLAVLSLTATGAFNSER